MNENNKKRLRMMDTALTFINEKGRDVRENAVRAYVKKQFPMDNEREQMLWVATVFRSLEEEKAIVRNGAVVAITRRGRIIMLLGGMERFSTASVWFWAIKATGGALSVVAAIASVWQNANSEQRTLWQMLVTTAITGLAGISIYSLLRFLRQCRSKRNK